MTKLFFIFILLITPICSNAISLQEINNNPSKYIKVYSDNLNEKYIDLNSIQIIRSDPPFYIINSISYLIAYDYKIIQQTNSSYYYDLTNNVQSSIRKSLTREEAKDKILKYAGVKSQNKSTKLYNFEGKVLGEDNTTTNLSIPKIGSPSYQSAMYIYFKLKLQYEIKQYPNLQFY